MTTGAWKRLVECGVSPMVPWGVLADLWFHLRKSDVENAAEFFQCFSGGLNVIMVQKNPFLFFFANLLIGVYEALGIL